MSHGLLIQTVCSALGHDTLQQRLLPPQHHCAKVSLCLRIQNCMKVWDLSALKRLLLIRPGCCYRSTLLGDQHCMPGSALPWQCSAITHLLWASALTHRLMRRPCHSALIKTCRAQPSSICSYRPGCSYWRGRYPPCRWRRNSKSILLLEDLSNQISS